MTWRPLVGPQFQNHVELRNTDGLMAFFISDYNPNMTPIQEQLLLKGHRDNRRVLLICHNTSSFFLRGDKKRIQPIRIFSCPPSKKVTSFSQNLLEN